MAAGVLSWDIVARDKASAPLLRVAESADKTAAGTSRAAESMARLDASMAGLSVASDKQRAAALRQVAAQERVDSVMASSRVSVERLATAQANLIGAQRGVAAAQEESAVAAGRFGGALGGTLKMARDLGLVFGGIEIAKKAIEFVSAGKDLTDALNRVQATSRATDTQMRAVRIQAIGLGKDLTVPGATAVDAADAILELVKAGIKLPRALQAARPALLLAAATQTNMADTARVLGDTMDIWSIKGQGAAHTAAILGSAALGASHDLVGLFDAIKQAGPSAQALGINVDDVSTALVYLAKHGLSTEMGGTGLKVMLSTLVKDTPKGVAALKDLGVQAFDAQGQFVGFPKVFDQLHGAFDRFGKVDSKRFLHDLNGAFGTRAQSVAALFAKATGKDFDDLKKHLEAGDLQKFADQTNRGVGASMRQMRKEFTAAGIDVYQKVEPAFAAAAAQLGDELPRAGHAAAAVLGGPLHAAWTALTTVIGAAAGVIGPVIHLLDSPIGSTAATGVLAMWAAFKGFKIAVVAGRAIETAMLSMRLSAESGVGAFRTWGTNVRGAFNGMGADAAATSAVMQAEFAKIEQSAMQEAAAVDRAAAQQAEAYAVLVAASEDASAKMIASSQNAALAAQAQADATDAALLQVTAAADAAALEVDAAGEAAAVGWSAVLGPIGLVAVGVLAVVSMFHKSAGASKEATDAAKAYSDALSSGGKSDLVDSITTQLKNNDLPAELKAINDGLGRTAFTGKQFVDAIRLGDPALATLRTRLQGVIKDGTTMSQAVGGHAAVAIHTKLTPAAEAATKALKSLNVQQTALTGAAKKEIANAKAFGMVESSVAKTTVATKLGTDAAKQYATMAGLEVDKNGVVAKSQNVVNAAVNAVARAYATATQSGSAYLSALDTFSKSAGTAGDRAAMIGSTLVAANGDALSYASAMNAAATANSGLVTSLQQAASQVGQSGISVRDLMSQLVNLRTGTINYKNAAAGPLISGLQGIQSAAMAAASATYQHARATEGGKRAADDAYKVYVSQTRGALMDEASQLGLTHKQAKKLADQYFGMPKKVKTAIETEGTNPVVDVLTKIGKMLALFTGQPWDINVRTNYTTSGAPPKGIPIGAAPVGGIHYGGFAAGGSVGDGYFTVGEQGGPGGWELGHKAGSKVQIFSNRDSRKMTGVDRLPGYAGGTGGIVQSGKDWIYNGIRYASQRAAENAETRAAASSAKQADSVRSAARSAIDAFRGVSLSAQSSASDLVSAGKDFLSAGMAAGLSKAQLQSLAATQRTINVDARARDRINARLGTAPTPPTAYDRLATAQQNYGGAKSTVRSAFTGSFDITQAGQNQYGFRVTFSAMKRQLDKAVADAKRFASVLRKLGHEGLNKGLIQMLADAGPSALPQALALASATPKQLRAFNAEYGQLGKAGGRAGTQVADEMYGAGVKSAQGLVNGLLSQRRALNGAIKQLADGMVATLRTELDMHSPSQRLFDEGAMAFEGFRQGLESKHGAIEAAARGAADKSIPGGAASGGLGATNGVGGPAIGELHLHYSHPDDYHRATAAAMRAATTVLR